MITKTITLPLTFTARDVCKFCELTNKLKSTIQIQKQNSDRRINAKSVLGMMSMCFIIGDVATFFCESEDELNCVLKWFSS